MRNSIFIGGPGVELQGQEADQVTLRRLMVGHLCRDVAVDLERDLLAAGRDGIVVPVVLSDVLKKFIGVGDLFGHFVAGG